MYDSTIGTRARTYAMAVLSLIAYIGYVDRQVFAVLLEPIKKEFQASDSTMGLLQGAAFAVTFSLVALPVSRLADHLSRRKVLAACVAIWSVMTSFSSAATGVTTLGLARVGVAVGEAGGTPTIHSYLFDVFPANRRATALSIIQAAMALGIASGVLVGGVLAPRLGWRGVYVAVGAPGAVLALLSAFTIKEPLRTASRAKHASLRESLTHLLKIPTFRRLLLIGPLIAFTGQAFFGWAPSFLIRVHHLAIHDVGIFMGATTAIGLVGGNLATGPLSDHFGQKRVENYMIFSAVGLAVAVPMGILFVMMGNLWGALGAFTLFQFFNTLWVPPTYAMAVALAPVHMRATASALMNFVQNVLGTALGPLFVGILNDHFNAKYGLEGIRWSMLISLIPVILAATACFWSAGHLRRDLDTAKAEQDRALA